MRTFVSLFVFLGAFIASVCAQPSNWVGAVMVQSNKVVAPSNFWALQTNDPSFRSAVATASASGSQTPLLSDVDMFGFSFTNGLDLSVSGIVSAGSFSGSGSALTSLSGGNIQSGTVNSNKFDTSTLAWLNSNPNTGAGNWFTNVANAGDPIPKFIPYTVAVTNWDTNTYYMTASDSTPVFPGGYTNSPFHPDPLHGCYSNASGKTFGSVFDSGAYYWESGDAPFLSVDAINEEFSANVSQPSPQGLFPTNWLDLNGRTWGGNTGTGTPIGYFAFTVITITNGWRLVSGFNPALGGGDTTLQDPNSLNTTTNFAIYNAMSNGPISLVGEWKNAQHSDDGYGRFKYTLRINGGYMASDNAWNLDGNAGIYTLAATPAISGGHGWMLGIGQDVNNGIVMLGSSPPAGFGYPYENDNYLSCYEYVKNGTGFSTTSSTFPNGARVFNVGMSGRLQLKDYGWMHTNGGVFIRLTTVPSAENNDSTIGGQFGIDVSNNVLRIGAIRTADSNDWAGTPITITSNGSLSLTGTLSGDGSGITGVPWSTGISGIPQWILNISGTGVNTNSYVGSGTVSVGAPNSSGVITITGTGGGSGGNANTNVDQTFTSIQRFSSSLTVTNAGVSTDISSNKINSGTITATLFSGSGGSLTGVPWATAISGIPQWILNLAGTGAYTNSSQFGALAFDNTVNSNLMTGHWNYGQLDGVPAFLTTVTSNNMSGHINASQIDGTLTGDFSGDGSGFTNLNLSSSTTNAAPNNAVTPVLWFPITNAGVKYLVPGYQ